MSDRAEGIRVAGNRAARRVGGRRKGRSPPRPEESVLPAPLSADEFAEQFASNGRILWCIASAIVSDRSVTEDVMQEAALIGLRKLASFLTSSC